MLIIFNRVLNQLCQLINIATNARKTVEFNLILANSDISDEFIAQSINYLKISSNKLALIVNFGELKLNYKRIVL